MITRNLRYLIAFALVLALNTTLILAADLTVTAASVAPAKTAAYSTKIAGAAITAGQPLYVLTSDNKAYLADANVTDVEANCVGIAVNNAAAGQPISYITSGSLTAGATLVAGTTYVISETAGKICPVADLTTGDYITILGVAKDAAVLTVKINVTGTLR